MIGVVALTETEPIYTCTPMLLIQGQLYDVLPLEPVSFKAELTPVIESISPRFGSVLGDTTVTLTGKNLLSSSGENTVLFDNRECVVTSSTETEIQCVTSDKPYTPENPSVEVVIGTFGRARTLDHVFRYVSLWSEPQTWGYDVPPMEGDAISIPTGQHLLFD